ncbi:hypothetical protein [Bacteroides sp. 51]|uniref:hypothetical protein n=1 Tax=Bacteroides sp. 51 TaxID=2302938 RepID=UPI0013D031A1|nr:hypothetical protein [Bacteroides sp. 51]
MTASIIILSVLLAIILIAIVFSKSKSFKSYQDYRLRKWCVKCVCKSSIAKPFGAHLDADTGSPIPEPLASEAHAMYLFIRGEYKPPFSPEPLE